MLIHQRYVVSSSYNITPNADLNKKGNYLPFMILWCFEDVRPDEVVDEGLVNETLLPRIPLIVFPISWLLGYLYVNSLHESFRNYTKTK